MAEPSLQELDTDVARVRLVLMRELETINTYEALARQSSAPEMKAFFLHLAAEEKEHVAEATAMLRRLDGGQEAYFQRDYSSAHFDGGAATPSEPQHPEPSRLLRSAPAFAGPGAGTLTVGPLKPKIR